MSEDNIIKIADITPKLLKKHGVTEAKVTGVVFSVKEIDTKYGVSHAFKGQFQMLIKDGDKDLKYRSKTAFLPRELAEQLVSQLINRKDQTQPVEFGTDINKVDADTAIGYKWDCNPFNMDEAENRLDALLAT